MKKILLVLPIAALLAACSKKDDKPAVTPDADATTTAIMGNWKIVRDTDYTTQNGKTTTRTQTLQENLFTEILTYNQNGTGVDVRSNILPIAFTYTISNNVIKYGFSGDNPEVDYTILSLSANQVLMREMESDGYFDLVLVRQ